jgi:thiosulfate dehydrogenase
MTRKWLVVTTLLVIVILFWYWHRSSMPKRANNNLQGTAMNVIEPIWSAPDSNSIPSDTSGDLIRYGKKLIRNTAFYFGPRGSVSHSSNGMNCQNCHLDAGTRPWAGSFGGVASLFPRYSDRRGSAETVNQRITDCFERSMNGRAPDSNSLEMKAMNAYIRWVGKDIQKGKKPKGTGLEQLPYLERPADPSRGKMVYIQKCQTCHGANGDGQPNDDTHDYRYPPLWGEHSYNTSAGIYRLSKFAGFIKDNMPYGSDYLNEHLSNEEAWDLAAFVNSQPRPVRKFEKDWPEVSAKPVDVPEGPFTDSFPALQHKYGPFTPIVRFKKDRAVSSK